MYVELKTVYDQMEANIIVSLLNDRNIETILDKDDAGGMHPHLHSALGIKILVLENDYDSAKKILDKKDNKNQKPWVCRNCGEKHEAQFLVCWNCGEAKI